MAALQRSVVKAESSRTWYRMPERHALRIPFAEHGAALEVIMLYCRELLLLTADSHQKRMPRRTLKFAGQYLHLLQNIASHTDLSEHDADSQKVLLPQLVRGSCSDSSIRIRSYQRRGGLADPYVLSSRSSVEDRDICVRITIAGITSCQYIFKDLIMSKESK